MKFKKGGSIPIDYNYLKKLMRKNGLVVLRKGNSDKFIVAYDGEKGRLNIYGNLIYEPNRDEGETGENAFYDFLIEVLKNRAQGLTDVKRNPREMVRGKETPTQWDQEYQATLSEDAKRQEDERHGQG